MKKQISFLVITGLLFSSLINTHIVQAAEAVQSGFNPDNLIDDKVFSNSKAMTAGDIQKFLDDKKSILANTSNSFVMQLKEPANNSSLKETLEDPNASSHSILQHRKSILQRYAA